VAAKFRIKRMIHLDTSVLVDALTGQRRSLPLLRDLLEGPEPVSLSSIVLFEWLRGPRLKEEIEIQEAIFPGANAVPFGFAEAKIASRLYKSVKRPRGREADLAVAACAMCDGASLWTLNVRDFSDVPALTLWQPQE
jgi:predicted nucleic acid-binding protein